MGSRQETSFLRHRRRCRPVKLNRIRFARVQHSDQFGFEMGFLICVDCGFYVRELRFRFSISNVLRHIMENDVVNNESSKILACYHGEFLFQGKETESYSPVTR